MTFYNIIQEHKKIEAENFLSFPPQLLTLSQKKADKKLSAFLAPLVGLEPTTYRLLHYTNFH